MICEDCGALSVPPYTFCREHARQNEIPPFRIPEHEDGWKTVVQEAPKHETEVSDDLVSWFYSDIISQYLDYCMGGNDLKLLIPVRPANAHYRDSGRVGWEFFIPLREFSKTEINELMWSMRNSFDNLSELYQKYIYTASFSWEADWDPADLLQYSIQNVLTKVKEDDPWWSGMEMRLINNEYDTPSSQMGGWGFLEIFLSYND